MVLKANKARHNGCPQRVPIRHAVWRRPIVLPPPGRVGNLGLHRYNSCRPGLVMAPDATYVMTTLAQVTGEVGHIVHHHWQWHAMVNTGNQSPRFHASVVTRRLHQPMPCSPSTNRMSTRNGARGVVWRAAKWKARVGAWRCRQVLASIGQQR